MEEEFLTRLISEDDDFEDSNWSDTDDTTTDDDDDDDDTDTDADADTDTDDVETTPIVEEEE
jgi:hypothetical protein